MKVKRGIGFLILLAVTIVGVAALALVVWAYANLQPKLADQKLHSEIIRLQGAAHVYRSRVGFYTGVCTDIGVQVDYKCNDDSQAFAVWVKRGEDSFYCVDSEAGVQEISRSPGESTKCVVRN